MTVNEVKELVDTGVILMADFEGVAGSCDRNGVGSSSG